MVVDVLAVSCCFFQAQTGQTVADLLCKQLVVIARGRYPNKPLERDFFINENF